MISSGGVITKPGPNSPFCLAADGAYRAWRDRKLERAPTAVDELMVELRDPACPDAAEQAALAGRLQRANMVIYRFGPDAGQDKQLIRRFGRRLGLERLDNNLCADEDSITTLRVVTERRPGEYIPYTNQRLNWHTDGYYNRPQEQVRGVILHCVRPAREGGENAFMDHEIAYILLRDENPDYVRALMAGDAMTIPANVQGGVEIRPEQGGPVFSIDADGHLHMRYSARTRNIVWKDDPVTRAAADFLLNLFQVGSPYIFRHRLEAGQGVVSNNVLHCRTPFSHDGDAGRLLYRARYFDRASTAGFNG